MFDMDVKQGEKEFADFDNAIYKGEKLGYKIAYSNDSFELWFYLHYNYTNQRNNRAFYYKCLGEQWGFNYVKFGKKRDFCETVYSKLEDDINASQAEAVKRATKLFEEQADLPFHQQNPITLVYKLVELLNKNLRR